MQTNANLHTGRKVIYSMIVSLDGYIEDRDGKFDWYQADEEMHAFLDEQEADIDTHLYGRRMYEVMSAGWSSADQDPANPDYIKEFSRKWQAMDKVVFSTTLDRVDFNSRLVRGDIAGEIARLKALPGHNISLGGAGIAASFAELDLIDEYVLYVQPVIVGGGKPFFPPLAKRQPLWLVEARPFGSGALCLRYQRANEEQDASRPG